MLLSLTRPTPHATFRKQAKSRMKTTKTKGDRTETLMSYNLASNKALIPVRSKTVPQRFFFFLNCSFTHNESESPTPTLSDRAIINQPLPLSLSLCFLFWEHRLKRLFKRSIIRHPLALAFITTVFQRRILGQECFLAISLLFPL